MTARLTPPELVEVVPAESVDPAVASATAELARLQHDLEQLELRAADLERRVESSARHADDGHRALSMLEEILAEKAVATREQLRITLADARDAAERRVASARAEADDLLAEATAMVGARSAGPERPPERGAGPERPPERGAGPGRPPERGAGPGRNDESRNGSVGSTATGPSSSGRIFDWDLHRPEHDPPSERESPFHAAAPELPTRWPDPGPPAVAGDAGSQVGAAFARTTIVTLTPSDPDAVAAGPVPQERHPSLSPTGVGTEAPAAAAAAAGGVAAPPAAPQAGEPEKFSQFWQAEHRPAPARESKPAILDVLLPLIAVAIVLVVVLSWIG